jgi:hypothetical protein
MDGDASNRAGIRENMPVIGAGPNRGSTSAGIQPGRVIRTQPYTPTYQAPVPIQQAPAYPYPWNGPYPYPIPNPYASPYPYLAPPISYPGVNYPYLNPVVPATFPVPVSIVYYDGGYDWSSYDLSLYPTIYGLYSGVPAYFDSDDSSVIVSPPSTYTGDDGYWLPYDYDPYAQADSSAMTDPAADTGGADSSQSPVPDALGQSLMDIAGAWKSGDVGRIAKHLGGADRVQVRFAGKYAYSIKPHDYEVMTRDAMHTLGTTDFRFAGVRVSPGGDSVGYAEQSYRTLNGQASKMYLALTLRKALAPGAGYTLVGIDTSTSPFTK